VSVWAMAPPTRPIQPTAVNPSMIHFFMSPSR
jgi:hypothetical protein